MHHAVSWKKPNCYCFSDEMILCNLANFITSINVSYSVTWSYLSGFSFILSWLVGISGFVLLLYTISGIILKWYISASIIFLKMMKFSNFVNCTNFDSIMSSLQVFHFMTKKHNWWISNFEKVFTFKQVLLTPKYPSHIYTGNISHITAAMIKSYNTLRLKQNGLHFAGNILRLNSFEKVLYIDSNFTEINTQWLNQQ